jgi:peptide/nickel transport system substrate-binding protein
MPRRLGEHTFARQRAALVAAIPLVVLAAGCGASRAASPTTTTAKTRTTHHVTTVSAPPPKRAPKTFPDFKIAMDESIDSLDPGLSDTTEGWGVMWNVYLPLIGYRHANGSAGATLVPYLARALPTISKNGMTYSLTLRPGLRYSNGTRVKASDFKKTIERDFLLDSVGAGLFDNIDGAKGFAKARKGGIPGIVVNDRAGTIVIHLRAPEADFENVLASEFAAPVPPTAPTADTSLHPLPSTGPYVIQSYQQHARIVEVRNPSFQAWRFHGYVPAGNPDRVTWDIVPDAGTALTRVLSGKDDWMSYWPIPAKRLAGLEKKHLNRLKIFTPPNLVYFFMNTRIAPFDKLVVRRAVNYALDRRWLVHLAGGLAKGTENILPPGYPSYVQHHLYRRNLALAQRLVKESGDKGAHVIVWNHDVAADLPFTEYLVSVLNRIGFHAKQKVVTASDYWSTLGEESSHAQIGFADFFQDYPHPLDWFGTLLDGRRISLTHNDDYANFDVSWVNHRIDQLTQQPSLTPHVNAQWAALDKNVMKLAPWAPAFNREEADFFSARVDLSPQCYVNNILYEFDYASICVKKP